MFHIGKVREGVNRVIKLTLECSDDRSEFSKNSANLKNAVDPWNKVYMKTDLHLVYVSEKNLICKKMYHKA